MHKWDSSKMRIILGVACVLQFFLDMLQNIKQVSYTYFSKIKRLQGTNGYFLYSLLSVRQQIAFTVMSVFTMPLQSNKSLAIWPWNKIRPLYNPGVWHKKLKLKNLIFSKQYCRVLYQFVRQMVLFERLSMEVSRNKLLNRFNKSK